jgi:hypothetical protein
MLLCGALPYFYSGLLESIPRTALQKLHIELQTIKQMQARYANVYDYPHQRPISEAESNHQ